MDGENNYSSSFLSTLLAPGVHPNNPHNVGWEKEEVDKERKQMAVTIRQMFKSGVLKDCDVIKGFLSFTPLQMMTGVQPFSRIFAPVISFTYSSHFRKYFPKISIGLWNMFDDQNRGDDSKFFKTHTCNLKSLGFTDNSLRGKIMTNVVALHLKQSDRAYTPASSNLRTFYYYFNDGVNPDNIQLEKIRDILLDTINYFWSGILEDHPFPCDYFLQQNNYTYQSVKSMVRTIQRQFYEHYKSYMISMMDLGRAAFLLEHESELRPHFYNFEDMLWNRLKGFNPIETMHDHPVSECYFHTSVGAFPFSEIYANSAIPFGPKIEKHCLKRLCYNFYDVSSVFELLRVIQNDNPKCYSNECGHKYEDLLVAIARDSPVLLSKSQVDPQVQIRYPVTCYDDRSRPNEFILTECDKAGHVTRDHIPRTIIGKTFDLWYLTIKGCEFNTCDYSECGGYTWMEMREVALQHWKEIAFHYEIPHTEEVHIFSNVLRQWEPPHVVLITGGTFNWKVGAKLHSMPNASSIFLISFANALIQFERYKRDLHPTFTCSCLNPFPLGTYDFLASKRHSNPLLILCYLLIRRVFLTMSIPDGTLDDIPFNFDKSGKRIFSQEILLMNLHLIRFDMNDPLVTLATYGDDRFYMDPFHLKDVPVDHQKYVLELPTTLQVTTLHYVFDPKPGSMFEVLLRYSNLGKFAFEEV